MVAGQNASGPPVTRMDRQDTQATAVLHASLLPDGFFARLGPGFLRLYHRSYIESPYALALTAGIGASVDGFLLAVIDQGAHGAWVVRRFGVRLAVRGLAALLLRPGLLGLFVRTRLARYARGLWRRRRPVPDGSQPRTQRSCVVLSHIAVAPANRGSGLGAALVTQMEREAQARGATGVVLLTAENGPGSAFYSRLGYRNDGATRGADGGQWLRFNRSFVRSRES